MWFTLSWCLCYFCASEKRHCHRNSGTHRWRVWVAKRPRWRGGVSCKSPFDFCFTSYLPLRKEGIFTTKHKMFNIITPSSDQIKIHILIKSLMSLSLTAKSRFAGNVGLMTVTWTNKTKAMILACFWSVCVTSCSFKIKIILLKRFVYSSLFCCTGRRRR